MAQHQQRLKSFAAFYPYYRSEHKRTGTRALHFIGTGLSLTQAGAAVVLSKPLLVITGVVTGYAFAWIGHFFMEQNRPATFQYPLWSLMADFKMFFNILTGRESVMEEKQHAAA